MPAKRHANLASLNTGQSPTLPLQIGLYRRVFRFRLFPAVEALSIRYAVHSLLRPINGLKSAKAQKFK
jgi:hypothetical protein